MFHDDTLKLQEYYLLVVKDNGMLGLYQGIQCIQNMIVKSEIKGLDSRAILIWGYLVFFSIILMPSIEMSYANFNSVFIHKILCFQNCEALLNFQIMLCSSSIMTFAS